MSESSVVLRAELLRLRREYDALRAQAYTANPMIARKCIAAPRPSMDFDALEDAFVELSQLTAAPSSGEVFVGLPDAHASEYLTITTFAGWSGRYPAIQAASERFDRRFVSSG